MNFLISYHRPTGKVEITSYQDMAQASHKVLQKELRETDSDMEHVVVVADSLEALKLTHSRYFMHSDEIRANQAA